MKTVELQLLKYFKEIDLETRFTWDVPLDCPLLLPTDLPNNYRKNIYLKEHLKDIINENNYFMISNWIIQRWGGIKTYKSNMKNDEILKNFIMKVNSTNSNDMTLTRNEFNIISSLSKVASFLKPELFIIYDSRVVFSLNWLIFLYSEHKIYFPQPTGRNSLLSEFDQKTVFNLSGKEFSYYNYDNAYMKYCDLVASLVNYSLLGNKIYQIEMLLFTIATKEIIEDMKKKICLTIAST